LYYSDPLNNCQWFCPICIFSFLPDNDRNLTDELINISENVNIECDKKLKQFISSCQNFILHNDEEAVDDSDIIFNNIKSKYYNLQEINKLGNDSSSLGMLHTNLASLYKYHDDLELVLSLLKPKFQIIGITEHKITGDIPLSNIKLTGYHDFIYNHTSTTHGGSGFYIKETFVYKRRNDLILKSDKPGVVESTFVELILPDKKNLILGCIYRHPNSIVNIEDFTTNLLEPVLNVISAENKICALMGDFNIDLLKCSSQEEISFYYNTLSSNFFAPYILHPSRPISKTLIDNIFINTIEFESHSGNLTIQLADHFFQFAILRDFFQNTHPRKLNIKERNFKNFNEREFLENLQSIDIDTVLQLEDNDPNKSTKNFYNAINFILDEMAPYKKLTNYETKLKKKHG